MNGDGRAASSANVDDGSWSRSVLFGGGARGCDEWGLIELAMVQRSKTADQEQIDLKLWSLVYR